MTAEEDGGQEPRGGRVQFSLVQMLPLVMEPAAPETGAAAMQLSDGEEGEEEED